MGWTEEFLVDAYVFGYPLVYNVSSMQAIAAHGLGSLPPAVLNFMVAEQLRQEPAKVASIVLIGNVMSVIFVPIGLALAIG